MYNKYNDGWIEVITGPMFSGKSAELIKRAETLIYAKKPFVVFKPAMDNRWEQQTISSRTGAQIKSITIKNSNEIKEHINSKTKAIIVDEVQFFDEGIVDVLSEFASRGIIVIVAGLDMDFKARPFKPMPDLLAIAEFITKLTAVCFECGRAAAFSKRITGSKTKTVEIGDDSYEARCRICFKKG